MGPGLAIAHWRSAAKPQPKKRRMAAKNAKDAKKVEEHLACQTCLN